MKHRSHEEEIVKKIDLILPDLQAGIAPADILKNRNLDWNATYIPYLKRKARALGYEIPRSSTRSVYQSQKKVVQTKEPQRKISKNMSGPSQQLQSEELIITVKGVKLFIPAGTKAVRILPDGNIEIM